MKAKIRSHKVRFDSTEEPVDSLYLMTSKFLPSKRSYLMQKKEDLLHSNFNIVSTRFHLDREPSLPFSCITTYRFTEARAVNQGVWPLENKQITFNLSSTIYLKYLAQYTIYERILHDAVEYPKRSILYPYCRRRSGALI
jgi:hypothetical protein